MQKISARRIAASPLSLIKRRKRRRIYRDFVTYAIGGLISDSLSSIADVSERCRNFISKDGRRVAFSCAQIVGHDTDGWAPPIPLPMVLTILHQSFWALLRHAPSGTRQYEATSRHL